MPIIQSTKRSRKAEGAERKKERCKCSRFPSSSVSNEIAFCNEEELKNTVIPMKRKKCQHSGYYCCIRGVMMKLFKGYLFARFENHTNIWANLAHTAIDKVWDSFFFGDCISS